MRNRWWAVAGIAAAGLLLAGCGLIGTSGSSGTSGPPAAASSPAPSPTAQAVLVGSVTIKTMSTSKGTVLANAAGMTLYLFAKDTPTSSACLAACKATWPPVILSASPAPGSLPKGYGAIRRPNGQIQLTFDGHPLYTFAGDRSPGQITGNGINANGGLWWAITPAGTELGSPSSSSSGGTTGSGGSSWG